MAANAETEAERRHRVAEATAREHEVMVRAMAALERALAAPAPGKEPAWIERTRRGLANVVGFLQEHCESAENEGGLLADAQLRLGQPRRVAQLRREHERLLRDAVALLAAMEQVAAEAPDYHEVRERAGALILALRRHQALEADLLMEGFQRDIGGGD